MPTTCDIEFQNPKKAFCAGQLLEGTACLTLTEEKLFRAVYIRISGKAITKWSDANNNQKGDVQRFGIQRTNLGDGSRGEVRLAPGTHRYEFKCVLPSNLSSSIEGEYGYVKYTARVVLEHPIMPNKEFKFPFTVIKALDLNATPSLREPVIVRDSKTFFPLGLLFFLPSGPLSVVATVPAGGYVPGETIQLGFNVNNQSNQAISKFTVQLIRQMTFLSSVKSYSRKFETRTVSKQKTRGCGANQAESIHVNIVVPSIQPTDTADVNIIKVAYAIRIRGSVTGFHMKPTLYVPIIIGSRPFQ